MTVSVLSSDDIINTHRLHRVMESIENLENLEDLEISLLGDDW